MQKRSREVLLEKYGRNKKYVPSAKQLAYVQKAQTLSGKDVLNDENPEISNPEYIDRLFEKTILYRISENGQKLPVEEAQRRIRKLNIVAHCHGAYVFLKLEEIMQQKLKDLGYTPKEASDIQKQLLCVAYAPYAPLGVSKSTMISFASAKDTEIWHQNTFHQQIRDLNQKGELNFSYFPDKKGDIFVAPSVIKNEKEELEHNFSNCISPYHELTKDGQNMLRFSRNAIVNGIKSSILNIPLGNIQSLVCGENLTAREIFQQALENGLKTYQNMLQYAKTCKHRQMAAKAKQHPSL